MKHMHAKAITAIVDSFVDAEGQSHGGKWRWEFHHYLGPTFLRKDGEPLTNQPGEHSPAWPHFERWLVEHRKTCKQCIREDMERAKERK